MQSGSGIHQSNSAGLFGCVGFETLDVNGSIYQRGSSLHADYVFEVPEEWIDIYLEKSVGLRASGAIAIEDFGEQFLKSVSGSYSAIVGLPMFELREALSQLGFFEWLKAN